MNKKSYNVIDLFCGCGGLSLGFEHAGYNLLLGIDMWKDALITYEHNHKNGNTLCADLANLKAEDVVAKIGGQQVDVIIGGPPCQGFSIAGKRIVDDERNSLYKSFVRMVEHFKPKAFLMENVPNILSIGEGVVRESILKDFQDLGYTVTYKVCLASDYGVPQNRRRAVFVGFLNGTAFEFPKASITKAVTCKEALSDLPEESVPDGNPYPLEAESDYQKHMRKDSQAIHNHEITIHDEKTKRIIAMVPDGGNYKDLPTELQDTRKVHIAWTRLCSTKPSITIDTGHRHHFHYQYNRIPTARESARIQSFPDDFVFMCSRTSQLKQIGNAVPPLMAQALAEQILKHLNGSPDKPKDMNTNKNGFYQVEDKYWQRIHLERSRYKNKFEDVLLYMANACCQIPTLPCKEYSDRYFNAIRMYPGNIDLATKTINNWRTEIPSLFGFYSENKKANVTYTSKMAHFLNENQDLTQFLRIFLFTFQYPGGHIKPHEVKKIIESKIRFKPAKLILQVLMEGNKILSAEGSAKTMSLSAEEATYCLFNDLRVTTGQRTPREVAEIVLSNRKNKVKYYNPKDPHTFNDKGTPRTKGDQCRQAGDVLFFMEQACLVDNNGHGYYHLNTTDIETLNKFVEDNSFFTGYDHLYRKHSIETPEIAEIEPRWFDYVNESMNPELFKTDISTLIGDDSELSAIVKEAIHNLLNNASITKNESGKFGESLIYGHEKMRLKLANYDLKEFVVRIVDNPATRPGYDIESYEADGTDDIRYIEVKTTVSKSPVRMYSFHMTKHEWRVAKTVKEHYCVYRLMVNHKDLILYVLRNPVLLSQNEMIDFEPNDDGLDISFDYNNFNTTDILLWQD